jgi:hypothetical protein
MPRRKWNDGLRLMGRPQTAPRQSWRKQEWITDELHPHGVLADVTPAPGRTYTRSTWPPRGRGRGESLLSPRRIEAKLRTVEVIRLRAEGHTWEVIARKLGYSDASGPYRAYKRAVDRMDWDRHRAAELRKHHRPTR